MLSRKRIFSGIAPTGIVHLGNYLGALRHWVRLQDSYECIYAIVDLHALTVPQNAGELRESIFATAAMCLALGVDPERSLFFVQSDVAEHSELAWILNCYSYFGELRRMTQFKDKLGGAEESANVGLFDYPVLMAADILLYDTAAVPVGDDQRQHLELARTISRRFNNLFGGIFTVPEPIIAEQGSRIMGLDDPTKKMSKSASSEYNFIALSDPPDRIRAKIKSAVTDSGREIIYDELKKPAVSNILTIMSLVMSKPVKEIEAQYAGKNYGVLKADLAQILIEHLAPIRERFLAWQSRPRDMERVLRHGALRARQIAQITLRRVRERLGLGLANEAKR